MQNLHRDTENAFFVEVYAQILCLFKKNVQFWSRFIKLLKLWKIIKRKV